MNQTIIENDEWEIWTPSGWSDFESVIINHNRETIILDDYDLECTPCHLIKINGVFVRADTLPHTKSKVQDVYDLYEVEKNHEYFTNDVVSHNCSVIYIDEASFIANDNEFYESTYPVISSGEETKIVMTSTPKGRRGMFFNIFENAHEDTKQSKNGYKRLHFTWKSDPRKGPEWKEKTLKEFGITRFMQEFECVFRGSSGTLISPVILQDLTFINPLNEGEDENLFIYENYDKSNHQQYAAFVDTAEGLGKDYSVITVINVSSIPHKVACIYRSNTISPILFPHTIVSVCKAYGDCPVLIESNNSSGGQVSYITYNELQYEGVILTSNNNITTNHAEFGNNLKPGVRTTRKTKSLGCSNLNTIIENNNLVINDSNALEELGTFILKGTSYEADKDCTDDIVMTLVIYAWYMTQDTFKEYSGTNLSEHIYMQQVKEAMEHIMPFGFILEGQAHQPTNYRTPTMIATVSEVNSIEDWLNS